MKKERNFLRWSTISRKKQIFKDLKKLSPRLAAYYSSHVEEEGQDDGQQGKFTNPPTAYHCIGNSGVREAPIRRPIKNGEHNTNATVLGLFLY